MTGWRNIIWALVAVVALASPVFAQGGGASSTGSISGEDQGRAGRRAARRHRHRNEPGADRPAHGRDQRGGHLSLSRRASGRIPSRLRAVGIPGERTRWLARDPGREHADQSRVECRDAAGERHGQRRLAGHRHQRYPHADQLRPADAVVAPERPRHVVAARDHAVGDAQPC